MKSEIFQKKYRSTAKVFCVLNRFITKVFCVLNKNIFIHHDSILNVPHIEQNIIKNVLQTEYFYLYLHPEI